MSFVARKEIITVAEWQDLKTCLQEICWEKGTVVSDYLLNSVIGLVIYSPDHHLASISRVREEDSQNVLKACENYLLNVSDPACILVRMQICFLQHYKIKDEIIAEHNDGIRTKTKCLVDQILKAKVSAQGDLEKLYRNIILLTILNSSLGNPSKASVIEEATAAMHSIFPINELVPFASLTVPEKQRQLVELEQITTGIRLYNRDAGRGGTDIDDLPTILKEGLNATKKSFDDKLRETCSTLAVIMNLLKKVFTLQPDGLHIIQRSDLSPDMIETLKSTYALYKQFEIILRKITPNVKYCETQLENEPKKMKATLQKLHDVIQFRHAVPSTQVYPLFMDLAWSWNELENTMVVLSSVGGMVNQFHNFILQVDLSKTLMAATLVLDERIKEELALPLNEINETFLSNCAVIKPDQIHNFDISHVEYSGFCIFMFVEGNGLLIEGVPSIGIVVFKNHFYAFSCAQAAYLFDQNPKHFIERSLTLLLCKFEYVALLGMETDYEKMKKQYSLARSGKEEKKVVLKKDFEMQTDCHPVDTFIDHSYEWNVWQSKLKSLQLVNLIRCKTTSVQTISGFKKLNAAVQVVKTDDKKIQTSCTSTTQTYFLELGDTLKKIKLT